MELECYVPSTLPCKGNVFLIIPKPQAVEWWLYEYPKLYKLSTNLILTCYTDIQPLKAVVLYID